MRTSDFDYDLPADRIAQFPAEPRDSARLLVDRGSYGPDHLHVRDLDSILSDGDLLVVNDTKVIPARLNLARASGGRVEVLLLEKSGSTTGDRAWTAMVKPGGRLRTGEELFDSDGNPVLAFGGRSADLDTFVVEFVSQADPALTIDRLGEMPLQIGRAHV